MTTRLLILFLAASVSFAAGPQPAAPAIPGHAFDLPARPTAPGAPLIYEHCGEAGPDETFYLIGENLTKEVYAWGVSATNPGGEEIKPRVQFATPNQLAATIPEKAHDGPIVVWVKNEAGFSEPVVLNNPQPWWCMQDLQAGTIRVFGRNLSQRPDFTSAHVYVCQPGAAGTWAELSGSGKYEVSLCTPFKPGDYEIWVHAGTGGSLGWGAPVTLHVASKPASKAKPVVLQPGDDIQAALDAAGAAGGGEVSLNGGGFTFRGTLRIPAHVTLSGPDSTVDSTVSRPVRLLHDPSASFPRLGTSGWDQSPGAIHSAGDTIEYSLDVPKAGEWTVWLRYATEMSPWKQTGVSGRMALTAGDSAPVPLLNLENTGSFGVFKWSKSATIHLAAGKQKLVWKNVQGGGISLDAYVFALDPAFAPAANDFPKTSADVLVLQGEDCTRLVSREGNLPGGDRAAVWLAGDGASIRNISIVGNAQVNIGIAVRSPEPGRWISGCRIDEVNVSGCDGKQAENCGVHLRYVEDAQITRNELWGRAPIFISGARHSVIRLNRLVSVTRFGGNAEAAILGRNETIEQCIIENNYVASPPGAEAGGATARRLIWLSTGHGSVTHNWISKNRSSGDLQQLPRFGGVAGTDQNVGEMILFEANHRTMFFGALAGADAQSVLLPKTIPPTPDNRLGSVKREQLAHDAAGNETPFWPPDSDDGSAEPPMGEYFVSVMSGRGQGQTRRVLKREGERLLLDRPWRVPPQTGSLVTVGTGYYQNHIVENQTSDGMTGIQLWISCIENVVGGNTIARQRKPGLFFYANGSTLASSMPRTWNRGISPLFWNIAEGNHAEECSAGALVTSGDAPGLPVEFPRALGNVLRHNSFLRSRTDGVLLTSRKAAAEVKDQAASISGTIVEFNLVRDAVTAYHAAQSCDGVVFRRNHAYFWYPVNNSPASPVAFQVDDPGTTVALEQNTVEGTQGVMDRAVIERKMAAP